MQLNALLGSLKTAMDANASKQVGSINEGRETLFSLLQNIGQSGLSAKTELATKVDNLEKAARKGLSQLHKETEKGNEELKYAISQAATLPQRGRVLMGILEAIKERNR